MQMNEAEWKELEAAMLWEYRIETSDPTPAVDEKLRRIMMHGDIEAFIHTVKVAIRRGKYAMAETVSKRLRGGKGVSW